MIWWLLAILSGLGLAVRNILFKVSITKIDAALGAMILSLAMAATAIGYFLYQRHVVAPAPLAQNVNMTGVMLAVVSGIGVASANIFLAFAYKAQGQASLVAIIQNGCAISLTIIIGVLVLGETIRPLQALGIVAAVTGILLIIRG